MSTIIRIIISVVASIIVTVSLVKLGKTNELDKIQQYKIDVATKGLGKWCNDQFVPGYWEFVKRDGQTLYWKELTGTGKKMSTTPSSKQCVVEETVN